MPVPSKAEQVAEAQGRAEGGVQPGENAAVETINSDAPVADAPAAPNAAAADAAPAAAPLPPVKGQYDDKRSDIVSRFRESRVAEAEAERDDISDFARSGMPPEFSAEPAADAPAPADAETPIPEEIPAAPHKYKVTVRGKELELTQEELIANAQIALASDGYLDEAKKRLQSVAQLEEQVRNNAQRAGQNGAHQPAQNGAQPTGQPAPAADVPPHQENDVDQMIQAIQFGDPADARTRFQHTLATEVAKATAQAVPQALQAQRFKDEGARSMKVLADFKEKHADLASDPMAEAAIERKVLDLQVEDLRAIGIDPKLIQTPGGRDVTPGDIAMAHRYYRVEGFGVRKPEELLQKATDDFVAWRGTKPTPTPPADPAKPGQAKVDVTVDRSVRRAAIPQQPSRTVAPRQDQRAQPAQPRDRSSVVLAEQNRRNLARGKPAA